MVYAALCGREAENVPKLTAAAFSDFYAAIWGHVPFQWQRDLAERVLSKTSEPWPEAIALPTASGKTACIDIAVFALAAQADRLAPGRALTAPRRIFFVVDRRVIVDEAYEHARKVADRLRGATKGILDSVANQLRRLSGGEEPLACFQLRGGMYRSDAWAHSPVQPAVIASTVDQLGSRLLFRAYGRSHRAWPIQAGMAGNDALVLLDEAHCAQPFLETLQAVRKYRLWGDATPGAPFHVVIMSATPPEGLSDVFQDDSDEPYTAGHPLGDRQLAEKLTELVQPTEEDEKLAERVKDTLKQFKEAKGSNAQRRFRKQLADLRADAGERLAAALARKAEALAAGRAVAVVAFANRVATARHAYRLLAARYGDAVVLLTGRMRPIDKDDTVAARLEALSADRSRERQLAGPIFVVATQTLEVGANLDFDVLVTECASLDALRQRFGRLNRMGRPIEGRDRNDHPLGAKAAILIRADQTEKSDDDPVYGLALAETWTWLSKQAGKAKVLNMGTVALGARLPSGAKLKGLVAPAGHAPVMLPSHVDCWVQTAPEPAPTPDVAVFLHGPERASVDVQVCWRADLPIGSEEDWLEILALCPPAAMECLPVPITTLRNWLLGDRTAGSNDMDVEGASGDVAERERGIKTSCVVRWRGRKDSQVISDPREIRPGDVVVIPVELGGWDVLGDLPAGPNGQRVLDWGDRAHRIARAKATLRLHPEVMSIFPETPSTGRLRLLAAEASNRLEADPESLVDDLRTAFSEMAGDSLTPGWLQEIAASLAGDRKLARGLMLHPAGGLVVRGSKRLSARPGETDPFSDEDDATASGTHRIGLAAHLDGVADFARRFAKGCGLSPSLVNAVELAARAHDLGKADPRFQAWLRGGNPWAGGELLAKSEDMPEGWKASERARQRVGYPEGGRHELLSVSLLERVSDLLPREDNHLEPLVLHLVASHHGYCRPFAPVAIDEDPVEVSVNFQGRQLIHSSVTGLECVDSGAAERFWALTRRYGWWGLAWLEVIMRLADHCRSEAEQQNEAVHRGGS
jgi:CRISPR-associated endonuclease/helicase Cas3